MTATFTTRAWSCTVRLVVDDDSGVRPAAADLVALLDRVDALASRFRADSVLSQANAAPGRPVAVPRLLVDLVDAALHAAEQTSGAVDPTVGATLRRLGYDRDISLLDDGLPDDAADPARRTPPPRADRRESGDWRDVRLDRETGLLTVPAGAALDLGATAKAYVADHAAHALHARYRTAVLVELGGDIAVAGERPGGWCVAVGEREGAPDQLVTLRHGGLVTSTTTVRHWRYAGRNAHHILDPRTGLPADGPWRTASVHAPCALAANVASTAAIVLGTEALPWLHERGITARLVAHDGSIATTGGWPAVAPAHSAVHPAAAADSAA